LHIAEGGANCTNESRRTIRFAKVGYDAQFGADSSLCLFDTIVIAAAHNRPSPLGCKETGRLEPNARCGTGDETDATAQAEVHAD
jgi:hypothetical protein